MSMSAADGQTRKKQGVSGECSTSTDIQVTHYKKDFRFAFLLIFSLTVMCSSLNTAGIFWKSLFFL